MTASAVLTPYGIVREADYRNHYAGPQMRLFDLDSNSNLSHAEFVEDPSSDDVLFGLILYGAADKNRFDIGSVRVGFPNSDCTKYVDKMDLMRLFPEAATKTPVEQIEDQAIVDLLLDEEVIFSQQEEQTSDERI